MSRTPIAEHALLSDCHTAALVSRRGSLDWLCLPRFDRPAAFARLLDDRAGHWSLAIAPADGRGSPHGADGDDGGPEPERGYVDGTMVLRTTVRTATGVAVLTEAMGLDADQDGHDLGSVAPRALLRRAECVSGRVELRMLYAPRPEFGLVRPLLAPAEGGVLARGGPDVLFLSTPSEPELDGPTARLRLTLEAGQAAGFALQHRSMEEEPPAAWSQDRIADGLDGTVRAWRTWSSLHQRYQGPWSDLVHHGGRVLQALTYQPTGAIVAAPTTSLPEVPGGERNWDYRYAWVRDASFTLNALWVAACPDEAHKFFSWMAATVASQIADGSHLQIMFGIGGEHDLSERTLGHLSGWRDSRPVRVGNAAWSQRQLDVYGELLDAAHRLADQLGELDEATARFLVQVAEAAAARWGEADHGIWEIRGEPREFVYSKLMCWVAMDRAVALAPRLGAEDRVPRWRAVREEIRRAILERGWSERAGAFTQSFGSDELDASNLMMPLVGFLPAGDPRMLATIRATAERLTDRRGLVFRYRAEDGLQGSEGTFLLCTFWLAAAEAMAGDVREARATFERAASFANDVGLLAEEVDEGNGELLGNFPQAFSHIGLINAAWAIAEAEEAGSSGGLPAP